MRACRPLLVGLLAAGCADDRVVVVAPEIPAGTRWLAAVLTRNGALVDSTGLFPSSAPLEEELDLGDAAQNDVEISVLAYTAEGLGSLSLPSEEVLRRERLDLASDRRLPRASWVGTAVLQGSRVEVRSTAADLPVVTRWTPECSVDACVLAPIGEARLVAIPGGAAAAAFAAKLDDDAVVFGTIDGRFFEFTAPDRVVPLTELSTSASVVSGARLPDARIALVSTEGGLAVAEWGGPFRTVAASGARLGTIAASTTTPSELFLSGAEGRLLRYDGDRGFEVLFERDNGTGRTDAAWIGRDDVAAAYEGLDVVVRARGRSIEALTVRTPRLVGLVGRELLIATAEVEGVGGGIQVLRVEGSQAVSLFADSGLAFTPRQLAAVDDRSFLLGGWRGELRFFHLGAESGCVITGLPHADLGEIVALSGGFFIPLADRTINRVAVFLPRREVPPHCEGAARDPTSTGG